MIRTIGEVGCGRLLDHRYAVKYGAGFLFTLFFILSHLYRCDLYLRIEGCGVVMNSLGVRLEPGEDSPIALISASKWRVGGVQWAGPAINVVFVPIWVDLMDKGI